MIRQLMIVAASGCHFTHRMCATDPPQAAVSQGAPYLYQAVFAWGECAKRITVHDEWCKLFAIGVVLMV